MQSANARQAEAAWLKARATARERFRAPCRELKRDVIAQLNAGLSAAAEASRELATIEDLERSLTGDWHTAGLRVVGVVRSLQPHRDRDSTTGRPQPARTGLLD